MPKLRIRHAFVAVMITLAMLAQGTWALAGTTGNISGTLTDSTNGKPVADAKITVVSPSQSAGATTDAGGHFTILSLAPDTYTVSVEKDGFTPTSLAGVTVFADQTQTVALTTQPQLKTIARVTSRAAGALVRPGTTSDVYSVNAATAAKVTGLGGGGSLDQAYSAIATMPGAYVPVGGAGWYQTVYIRGGDYDQVGYEVDGVPVNRAFDNYPSSTASALGQQEVQVYTGANPANSEGQGLSGFINQVIKAGTYPGFGNSDLALGGPIFYHKAMVEAGGANPNRTFSYYAGIAGYNQGYRYLDNSEGAGLQGNWGTPFINCPAGAAQPAGPYLSGCYSGAGTYMGNNFEPYFVLGPTNYDALQMITDRENVANFHFAIPHKYDGGRDDLQILYQASDLKTMFHLSPGDWGSAAFYNTSGMTGALGSLPQYPGESPTGAYGQAFTYNGPVGVTIPVGSSASAFGPVAAFGFPSATGASVANPFIPFNQQDSVDNAIGMVKLQYQKNFGSSAYLRVYGYTVFSNWFNWGPNSANDFFSGSIPTDYELSTHTRGVSGTFADQINAKNLVQLQASYTDATSLRMNNTSMFNGGGTRIGVLVSSANPTNGVCYNAAGVAANCDRQAVHFSSSQLAAFEAGTSPLPATPASCGGSACTWYMADTGLSGRDNTVRPKFTSGSITDEWTPTDALHVNLGLRYDRFEYVPSKTDVGARPFWTNAFNQSYCVTVGGWAEKVNPAGTCAAANLSNPTPGATYTAANVTDVSNDQAYTVVQPRVGLTYTLNPFNVLRFSYGEYDQAPNAAFEQYDALNQNLSRTNRNFLILGFTAPTHPIVPEISYNTDLSWEHQLKGTDMSFKISPFYRRTKDQIQQFYLDLKTNFVSGLNVGAQTSDGVEFQFQKGDFNRNGFSGLLSYTYTNAYVKYAAAPNGATPITTIDGQIGGYNQFTGACNPANGGSGSAATTSQFGLNLCGGNSSANAAVTNQAFPCYTPAGVGVTTCVAGDTANPYWNAAPASFFDPFGTYAPYDLFAGPAPGAGNYGSFVAPHVATLVLNYKHDKFSITPAFQLSAGNKWGYPISTLGIDPSTCLGAPLAGSVTGDPRYPNGAPGGNPYNATGCGTYAIPIPNPATGKFDPVGGFTSPARLTISTQLSYDVSPRVSAVLTLANIYDGCFGGTKGAWSNPTGVNKSWVCGFGGGYSGVGINPIGNNYNPGDSIQPFQSQSYYPGISHLPFNAYLDFKIKL